MDSKGKVTALTPPYRQDAKKGYLPLDDSPHAGPEPSGYAPWRFLTGNSSDSCKKVEEGVLEDDASKAKMRASYAPTREDNLSTSD